LRVPVGDWHPRTEERVRGVRRPRRVGPAARDAVAALHRHRLAGGRRRMRRAEVAVLPEQLGLRLLAEVAADDPRVAGAEGEAPAGPRVAAGDLHHGAQERREIELQTAEPAGLDHAVEARAEEL